MELTKENLKIENGITKEWLITNGIGGFSSSTIIGANTRRYHGLLVASITPPARRHLILSKLDESIKIGENEYPLYTNIGKNYVVEGFKYQTSFRKEYIPIFQYEVEDVKITKMICMEYGKNTVGIYYKIKNSKKDAKLTLAPVMNFRDFHAMSTNHEFEVKQEVKDKKVKIAIDEKKAYPIYIYTSEGNYIKHEYDTFRNMFYIEEEKRGFFPEENHVVPGVFEISLKPNEEKEISVVCSMEENIDQTDVKEMINAEIIRLNIIFNESLLIDNRKENKTKQEKDRDEFIKELLIATDNFVVNRPSFGLHTIIAGYPWFLDWGRDSLLSFEGILLIPKRFKIAKEVLLTYVRDMRFGLVPNGYSGYDNRPLYNSADSALLLFEQVKKYIDYTGDYDFIEKNIYPKLEDIINNYVKGIDYDDNNIYLDEDNLLITGTDKIQNTWMDAKYQDFVVTPRNGKAVEINSLWYNALKIMADLTTKMGKKTKVKVYKDLAEKCKKSFQEKFYQPKRKCLYDVLGDKKIRPNQLFSLSLTYPIIDPSTEIAQNIIDTVTKKLYNPYGLKTLAKGERNYIEIYEGDSFHRDMSYHQGITWTWLLGLYYNVLKNRIKAEKNKKQKKILQEELEEWRQKETKIFEKELRTRGCIGSIAEIYDSKKPYLPKGAIAQAWSVAAVLRIVLGK